MHTDATAPPPQPMTTARMLAYAAPGLVLAVVGVPLFIYIPKFYTDSLGADAALVGAFIFAARIFDAVTDPVAGVLSDRVQTRWGRRRPFLFFASPLLGAALFAMYAPPELSAVGSAMWFGVLLLLLSLLWTLVDVPWESLGPELIPEYERRNALFAFRDGAQIVGLLLAVSAPVLLERGLHLSDSAADERTKFFLFAMVCAPLIPAFSWWCAASVRETHGREGVRIPRLQDLKVVWRNRPFRVLTASFAIAAIGANLPATLILYYVEYVLGDPSAEVYLLLYFLVGIGCLPGWVWLAKRLDKKGAWMWAMGINAGAFVFVFFLGRGDTTVYALLVALSGVGFGAGLALPASMQADVIDLDEERYGERREGVFIGVWSVVRKLSSALGLGVALPLLAWAGYEPGQEQNPQVLLLLRVLYAGVPSLCALAAMAVLRHYDLDAKAHAAIRSRLDAKRHDG